MAGANSPAILASEIKMNKHLIIWILIVIPAILFPGNLHMVLSAKFPDPNNYFQIHVRTNINHFVIKHEHPREFTKKINADTSHKPLNYTKIVIPVDRLKLKNKRMQQEFYQMLKADKHPFINIRIPEKDFYHVVQSASEQLPAYITIAGVTNKTKLLLDTRFINKNQYFVKGTKTISLYDYQLSPPQKLGGLIKVDSTVIINFGMSVFFKT